MSLSVCILAFNASTKLKRCLDSVKSIATEIVIVIDDQTTDNSEVIAREYTDRIFIRGHEANFHKLKQFAVEQASQKWILWLDDDEELEPELAAEIKNITECHPEQMQIDSDRHESHSEHLKYHSERSEESSHTIPEALNTVFQIPRKNIIFDQWIQHTGWYPDYQLRLWRQSTVHWPCKSVHEHPEVNGQTISSLKHHLIHYNYQSVSQWLSKLDAYSTNDAHHFTQEFTKPYYKHFLVRPIDEFISRYMKDQGYKDGLHGLVLSLLQSFYMFIVVVKAWEMQKFEQQTLKDPLQLIEQEERYLKKVWKWWLWEEKIQSAHSMSKKALYKLSRKLT